MIISQLISLLEDSPNSKLYRWVGNHGESENYYQSREIHSLIDVSCSLFGETPSRACGCTVVVP